MRRSSRTRRTAARQADRPESSMTVRHRTSCARKDAADGPTGPSGSCVRRARLLVLAILALILVTTASEAWPAVPALMGLQLRHRRQRRAPAEDEFGALAVHLRHAGRLARSPCSLAVPVSRRHRAVPDRAGAAAAARPIVIVIDLLAAVPSVVFGLWGILVLAPGIVPSTTGARRARRHPGAADALRRAGEQRAQLHDRRASSSPS